MENPSLQLGNSNWAVKEGGLLGYSKTINKYKPIEFNATRATTGTRINTDGLIEVVPYNLVSYSQECDNNLWVKADGGGTKINVIPNQTIAPNGSLTADLVVPTTDYIEHAINPILSLSSLGINRIDLLNWSTYVKPAGNNFFILRTNLNNSWVSTIFDIENGTIVSTHPNFVSSNITNSGNGWYRISVVTENMTIYDSFQMISTPTGAIKFSGDGVSGAYMWGTQITRGDILKDYYPTTNRLNIPRINGSSGVLIEPQRSNYFIDNSYSDKNNTTNNTWLFTRKPNQGIYGLDSIEGSAQGGYVSGQVELRYTPSLPAGSYTHTFYVKKNCDFNRVEHLGAVLYDAAGQSQQSISFNTTTGYISSNIGITIKNVSDKGDWWKISYVIYSSGGLCYFDYEPYYNTGGSFEICGSQIEFGIGSTSFIPTLTSVVTRNADIIIKTNAIDLIGQTEGSVYIHVSNLTDILTFFSLSNNGQASRLIPYRSGTHLILFFQDNLGTVIYSNLINNFFITEFPLGIKLCLTYNSTTHKYFINGELIVDISASLENATFSKINIGSFQNDGGQANATFENFLLWKTQLTDEEAINLTTL